MKISGNINKIISSYKDRLNAGLKQEKELIEKIAIAMKNKEDISVINGLLLNSKVLKSKIKLDKFNLNLVEKAAKQIKDEDDYAKSPR